MTQRKLTCNSLEKIKRKFLLLKKKKNSVKPINLASQRGDRTIAKGTLERLSFSSSYLIKNNYEIDVLKRNLRGIAAQNREATTEICLSIFLK